MNGIRTSSPSRAAWDRNIVFATYRRDKIKPAPKTEAADHRCNCLLPWAIALALATALLIQSARE